MVFDEVSNKVLEDISFQTLKEEYSRLYLSNKETLDGIYYAATVQQGLLPQERHFKRNLDNYFVLYRPQQIIGGDLYWIGSKNDVVYFATADCTGHGVSGAMLSVLAISFLNYILLGKEHEHLGEILSELDKKWIETFDFSLEYVFDNDWMEISLVAFNSKTRELKFSSANSNAFVINGEDCQELKGAPYPIGGWQLEKNRVFNEQTLILQENTMVYLGSDGFKDQFGGDQNKRFTKKRLKSLLTEVSALPIPIQKKRLETAFENWKGAQSQTDDLCIMGICL
jgi:serine phosphatase RsbU (regulator of sigma subunit)